MIVLAGLELRPSERTNNPVSTRARVQGDFGHNGTADSGSLGLKIWLSSPSSTPSPKILMGHDAGVWRAARSGVMALGGVQS